MPNYWALWSFIASVESCCWVCSCAYKRLRSLSFSTTTKSIHSPLVPVSLPLSQKIFFVLVIVFSQVLVRRESQVVGAHLASEVVVSWEAFAHDFQHLWESDKKLQGNRPTGLDFSDLFLFSRFLVQRCNRVVCNLFYVYLFMHAICLLFSSISL